MGRPLIIHVINSLTIGGAEVLLKNSVNLLKDYRHLVVYLHGPDTMKKEFSPGVEFICLDHRGWKSSISTIRGLKKIITEKKPILVHAHLFNATLLSRLALPKGTRFIFTIHNILSKDAFEVNRLSLRAERLTYKKNQEVISVSKEALDDYDQWVGLKGKSWVLYNYVDQSFFNLAYDGSRPISEGLRLVAVGNLRRQKNYGNLLLAFEKLRHLPVSVDIYGGGDLQEELSAEIEAKGLKVRLMGRVGNISEVLGSYHAYIMPSLFEGFGIAPMEAMAAGMPVLLSDLGVFREIAGDQPVYFNPADPSSIASAIGWAWENWEDLLRRSATNRSIVKALASKEVYLSRLQSIYDNH